MGGSTRGSVATSRPAARPTRSNARSSPPSARWTGGAHDAEYRETWPGFLARVDGALARLPGGGRRDVLVFTSGGPIAAACRAHLGATRAPEVLAHAFRLANASVTTLDAGPGGLALREFNDHAHLSRTDAGLVTFR